MNTILQQELKKILNGRFSQSESTRLNYSRGEDTYDPILSKAVVFPETNEEVSKILKNIPYLESIFFIFSNACEMLSLDAAKLNLT